MPTFERMAATFQKLKAAQDVERSKIADALEDVVLKDTYVGTARYGGQGAYGIKRQGVYDCYTMLIEDQKGFLADVRFPELPPGYD